MTSSFIPLCLILSFPCYNEVGLGCELLENDFCVCATKLPKRLSDIWSLRRLNHEHKIGITLVTFSPLPTKIH